MSSDLGGRGKLAGKTKYAGRRRPVTRESGFSVHRDTTGGEFRRSYEQIYKLRRNEKVELTFELRGQKDGDLIGYGVWFWHTPGIVRSLIGGPVQERTLTDYVGESWNKAGSIWKAQSSIPLTITFTLTATMPGKVAIYAPICGHIRHEHLDAAREPLLRNMYQYAPEAIFIADVNRGAKVNAIKPRNAKTGKKELILKSCNDAGVTYPQRSVGTRPAKLQQSLCC